MVVGYIQSNRSIFISAELDQKRIDERNQRSIALRRDLHCNQKYADFRIDSIDGEVQIWFGKNSPAKRRARTNRFEINDGIPASTSPSHVCRVIICRLGRRISRNIENEQLKIAALI